MQEVVLKEKIDFNQKGSFFSSNPNVAGDTVNFKLLRNSGDDTFNLEATQEGNRYDDVSFNVNNKSFPASLQPRGNVYKAHSAVMDSPKFGKSAAISAYFGSKYYDNYASISLFPIISPIDKNLVLKPNTYLHLETLDSIDVEMPVYSSDVPKTAYEDDLDVKLNYTNTYVVPRSFDSINGNKTLFDIYVDNDANDSIVGDVGYLSGQVTTSATGSTKIGLNTMPLKEGEDDDILGVKKVSTIDVFDYTYYDYEKKKLSVGFDDDSEKGLRVPYDFSGNFRWISKISPNYPFSDMNIMQSKDISRPLLDPYEGRVSLKIEDIEQEDHDWRIISADSFERLEDIDPSILGLERISYEENL